MSKKIESEPANEPIAVTSFRIYRSQLDWLSMRALRRRTERGSGKADASEILREILARVIKEEG